MANQDSSVVKILVADDEEEILDLYGRILSHPSHSYAPVSNEACQNETDNGIAAAHSPEPVRPTYELTLCRQGDEAIEAVRSAYAGGQLFAMAFLDVRMPPGSDGIWTAENIRAISADTQIVIVTGYTDIDPLEIEQRIPPPDRLLYVQKPFHPFEIFQFASTLAARWQVERKMHTLNRELELIVQQRTAELQKANQELEHRAMHDFLTGLPNRRAVLAFLQKEIARTQRTGDPLSAIMVDLDHFKQINDSYGHSTGDEVLVETARRMIASVRPYDAVGRIGGEEFLIVLPDCGESEAMVAADRICCALKDQKVMTQHHNLVVTASFGVATTTADQILDQDSLITAVDNALYCAKNAGRNTIKTIKELDASVTRDTVETDTGLCA